MCRLLGYAAPAARTVESVLGASQIGVFQDLALLHQDGWGGAWLTDDGDLEREATSGCGARDDRLRAALTQRAAASQIMHLRLATGGLAVRRANTHPFLADGLAFAHNGNLSPVASIEPFIDPEIRRTLRGDTDSERYFAVIRTKLAQAYPLVDAVVAAVSELRPLFPNASLNALVISPTTLVAVHASEDAPVPHHRFDASGLGDALPRDHRNGYYLMRQRRLDDGAVIFASSGLDIAGWEPLPADSVVALDLATLTQTVHPLQTAAVAAA